MSVDEARVASLVREAFQGVKLGGGVGLMQGEGLDDYADDETLARYRDQDEKEDWSRISVADLNQYAGSLCFFDAAGMRFHLPAFLTAHLQGTLTQDVLFHLTYLTHGGLSRFASLSEPQRNAVREFLTLELSRSDRFARPRIEKAVSEYWTLPGNE